MGIAITHHHSLDEMVWCVAQVHMVPSIFDAFNPFELVVNVHFLLKDKNERIGTLLDKLKSQRHLQTLK